MHCVIEKAPHGPVLWALFAFPPQVLHHTSILVWSDSSLTLLCMLILCISRCLCQEYPFSSAPRCSSNTWLESHLLKPFLTVAYLVHSPHWSMCHTTKHRGPLFRGYSLLSFEQLGKCSFECAYVLHSQKFWWTLEQVWGVIVFISGGMRGKWRKKDIYPESGCTWSS